MRVDLITFADYATPILETDNSATQLNRNDSERYNPIDLLPFRLATYFFAVTERLQAMSASSFPSFFP
jgi:hypothetical protein